MSVKVNVTNQGERAIGRLNRIFPPGESVVVEASAWRLPEISRHPALEVELEGASTNEELEQAQAELGRARA